MLRQGTLSSEEERTRPATTLTNVTGSGCKVLPNKQGESLPHEAPNEGQASERLYPSAVPSGSINHEFFQSYQDDDNKQQTTNNKQLAIVWSSRKMSCELTLFALKLDGLLHSSFASQLLYLKLNKFMREFCKVMVRHEDEPTGVRRDRIRGEDI
jgi:hypothetical protein